MSSEWICGCGWINGCDLSICARCSRNPQEGYAALRADIVAEKDAEIERLKATIAASDERLQNAAERVGIMFGCDSADWMAERIAELEKAFEQVVDITGMRLVAITQDGPNFIYCHKVSARHKDDVPELAGVLLEISAEEKAP